MNYCVSFNAKMGQNFTLERNNLTFSATIVVLAIVGRGFCKKALQRTSLRPVKCSYEYAFADMHQITISFVKMYISRASISSITVDSHLNFARNSAPVSLVNKCATTFHTYCISSYLRAALVIRLSYYSISYN